MTGLRVKKPGRLLFIIMETLMVALVGFGFLIDFRYTGNDSLISGMISFPEKEFVSFRIS